MNILRNIHITVRFTLLYTLNALHGIHFKVYLRLQYTSHYSTLHVKVHFALQLAIGLQDLGQFYHQPVKDTNGSIILTTVHYLNSTKAVNTSQHVKWVSLGKMQRRSASAIDAETLAVDMLLDLTNVNANNSLFLVV